ncbi:Hypothetical protein NGAL_HAMBI1145_26020 [Neorhizobium galegae bv. officinalis]|jgi:hypothetical protein|uniref:Uncharacterized protein n=1 Tax=Neorhizobium galegae bv. officinalis TaxID=323656 RepID=A0A0T7FIY6_NEOGA|nr:MULTISPECIES: hypothetical protein [Neorhizobium]CDZ34977.1 Hypothetical protein NGAL_HAMBI1145_26020 [Neorhizobium galegae bv. officinalis]
MDAERKIDNDKEAERFETDGRERAEDALHAQMDMTNQEAVKEASRLGAGDTYLVETDLEDLDEREDVDQPDGRPSPMANADNPER